KTLRGRSPTSLKVTLRQLRLGREMDYEDVDAMEYRLSQGCMAGHDFYEGIRAVLVDKDHSPHWEPAALSGVLEADV
ncbi:enoyl-CoA hydratase/isomerase family protein, partial [Klebsiella pneumoniae]|uniref:enoyl-CoA hydratase/isomerase family protein n=1 Tax=Klebsiella pneumoniae TaxID=573 RepID=UPI0034D9665E